MKPSDIKEGQIYKQDSYPKVANVVKINTVLYKSTDPNSSSVYVDMAKYSGTEDAGAIPEYIHKDVYIAMGALLVDLEKFGFTLSTTIMTPKKLDEPKNNGQRETCFWCGKPTEHMFGRLMVCRICNK